jgi:hypothetical protein
LSIEYDSVGLSPSALSGPTADEPVPAAELLIVLMSTNKNSVTPRVKAVTVPEINISWTIQPVLYRGGEAQVKAHDVF